MKQLFQKAISGTKTIAITGHKHPDGDCVGACMAMYLYLTKKYPKKQVTVYLETPPENLAVLPAWDRIDDTFTPPAKPFDLFLILDCSSEERFPAASEMVAAAKSTFVIDHHMTNTHFANGEVVVPDASSTCEVLYDLFSAKAIDEGIATALYLGIVHDTGVFKYGSCKEHTMQVAGKLLSKGVDAQRIIDDTFYRKTFLQNRIIGYATLNAKLFLDGRVIFTQLSLEDMQKFGAKIKDTEGVVDQIRLTEGIEVALFAREDEPDTYKLSMRAISKVNVASICQEFGGGGHRLAAGCNTKGPMEEVLKKILALVEEQL